VAPPTGFVRAEGQRLLAPDGNRLFFIADTAWRLCERLGDNAIGRYLDIRKAQGFNTIILGTDGAWWESPGARRQALWTSFDSVLAACLARGMYVIPTIQLQEYVDGRPVLRLPASFAGFMGQNVGARYCDTTNILFWMVGGLDEKGVISPRVIEDISAGLRAGDPNHLITYHPASRKTSVDGMPIGVNHDVLLYQSYQEVSYNVNAAVLQTMAGHGLPFANIEPIYEGAYGSTQGSPEDIDRVAATCAKQKVCGMAYGHHDVWSFASNWEASTKATGVAKFMAWTKQAVLNR
jgi:hypothetical protein